MDSSAKAWIYNAQFLYFQELSYVSPTGKLNIYLWNAPQPRKARNFTIIPKSTKRLILTSLCMDSAAKAWIYNAQFLYFQELSYISPTGKLNIYLWNAPQPRKARNFTIIPKSTKRHILTSLCMDSAAKA